MPGPNHSSVRNRLLRALPSDDYVLLQPHLTGVEVKKGDVLVRSGQPFDYGYFPESGLSSSYGVAEAEYERLIGPFRT